jgi:hypothetical protein
MRILQVLILIGLVCSFSFSIKAQADCRYGLKFFVQDEAGKTIENAKLELVSLDSKSKLPSYVKLIRIDNAYLFTSHAGTTVSGDFQVIVSAEGFETHQQKVNFPVCRIQDFDINLKSLTKEQNTSILSGSVYDAYGAVIIKAKVTAKNEKGETFEAETNNEGIYFLKLPFNNYDPKTASSKFKISKYVIIVDLEERGFEKSVIKDFKFISTFSGKMIFDIALDSLNPEPCGYGGADCLQEAEVKPKETVISKKVLQKHLEKLPKAKTNKRKNKNNKQ